MSEAQLFPTEVRFTVYGNPAPKGSTRSFAVRRAGAYTGQVVTTAASPRLAEWDAAIRAAIAQQADGHTAPIPGPVRVHLAFWLPRPKSHPKSRRTWPSGQPDLDKLVRAVLDPMSGVLIEDDARVIGLLAEEDWAGWSGPPDSRPRVDVWVWMVQPDDETGGT